MTRGPDIVAVALTAVLGLFSVGDIVFLSIRERSAELATLRATGRNNGHLIRLLTTEGSLLELLGATVGVVAGLWTSWRLTHTLPADLSCYWPPSSAFGRSSRPWRSH